MTGAACSSGSPLVTKSSPSRSATGASRTFPTSATSGSSIPRPGGGCMSTPTTEAARAVRVRCGGGAGVACVGTRLARRPPRRPADCGRLAATVRIVRGRWKEAAVSFASPSFLWLLLIPLAAALYVLAQRRRVRYAARFQPRSAPTRRRVAGQAAAPSGRVRARRARRAAARPGAAADDGGSARGTRRPSCLPSTRRDR